MAPERKPFPYKMIAVDPSAHAAAKELAKAEQRSIGAVVQRAIRFYGSLPLNEDRTLITH